MTSSNQPVHAWHSPAPGLQHLTWGTLPRPRPRTGEVLVQVEAAALNFSDLLMIQDQYQIRPPRPFVPGQEIAGTVLEVGDGCDYAIGTPVTGKVLWGGLSEVAVMRSDMLMAIPKGMGFVEAAAMPVSYTTAYFALTVSTQVSPGDTVLVLAAAGGIGLASVEIAHHLGARVIALAGGDTKCAVAREHGAAVAVDYRSQGWTEQLKTLVGDQGVDVIVDPVGGDMTAQVLRRIAWGGRLLVVGFASGAIPQIPANRLLLKRASAIGVYWDHDRDGVVLKSINAALMKLAESGAIRPHVGAQFSFHNLPQALAALGDRQTTGKVVLTFSKESRNDGSA